MSTAVKVRPDYKDLPAHILIMEDDRNVARGLKLILDEDGYSVDIQETGNGALKALGMSDYDLLMADIRLPDIDGLQVIRQVKEMKPATGIIAMSGYATSSMAVEAMKLGAHDFLAKPFTEEQIRHAIQDMLTQNPARVRQMSDELRAMQSGVSIEKRVVLKVLNRTCEDSAFWSLLMDRGTGALSEYALSAEAKAAIACGDLRWLNENVGELNQKQLRFVYSRLEREAW
ncbi:MAG: response regulator [Pseudomonadota bacterium]